MEAEFFSRSLNKLICFTPQSSAFGLIMLSIGDNYNKIFILRFFLLKKEILRRNSFCRLHFTIKKPAICDNYNKILNWFECTLCHPLVNNKTSVLYCHYLWNKCQMITFSLLYHHPWSTFCLIIYSVSDWNQVFVLEYWSAFLWKCFYNRRGGVLQDVYFGLQ